MNILCKYFVFTTTTTNWFMTQSYFRALSLRDMKTAGSKNGWRISGMAGDVPHVLMEGKSYLRGGRRGRQVGGEVKRVEQE